jgi:hypothetical protein
VIKKGVRGCTPGFEIYVNDRRVFISTKELRAKRYVAGNDSAPGGGGGGSRPPSVALSSSGAAPGSAAEQPIASGAVSVEWSRLETFDIKLHGDVRFAFRDVAQEASDAADAGEDAAHAKLRGQRLFHFCFNTAFIGTCIGRPNDSEEATSIAGVALRGDDDAPVVVAPCGAGESAESGGDRTLTLAKFELDGARKDKKCKVFPPNFECKLHFRRATAASAPTPLKQWHVKAKMTAQDKLALQSATERGAPGTALFPAYAVRDDDADVLDDEEVFDEGDEEDDAAARLDAVVPFHAPGGDVVVPLYGGDFAPASGSVFAPGARRLTAHALLAHVDRLRATRFAARAAARVVPWVESDDSTPNELRDACPPLVRGRIAHLEMVWSRLPLREGRECEAHAARCRWWLRGPEFDPSRARFGAAEGATIQLGVCVDYEDEHAADDDPITPLLGGAEAVGAVVLLTLEAEKSDDAMEALSSALALAVPAAARAREAAGVELAEDPAALVAACRAAPERAPSDGGEGRGEAAAASAESQQHEWVLSSSDCAGGDGTLTAVAIVRHVEDWLVANVVGEAIGARLTLSVSGRCWPRPGQRVTVDVSAAGPSPARRRTFRLRLGVHNIGQCVTSELVTGAL